MATLLDVTRVRADGVHNAFTDLRKWRDHYYLCFRTAEHHGTRPPGEIVVLRSRDARTWEPCGRLTTAGDDRDPKLVDLGDRLAVTFGTWYPRWAEGSLANGPEDLITHVCFTHEGTAWSEPRQLYGVNYWLWRVLPVPEGFLCAAYHFPVRADRVRRSVHLLHSEDMLDWRLRGQIREGGGCGEPVLFAPAEGQLRCLIRTLEPDNHSWLGRSVAPYTEWEWRDLGVMIHAPVVLRVGERWIVAGRSQPHDLPEGAVPLLPRGTVAPDSGHHTTVWALADDGHIEHLLTVPSAGDCSYCGLAHGPEGEVLMSYYSQHERMPLPSGHPTPDDIFLARFAV